MAKIGRNEPCPCGSGKKYKHCCQGKKARLGAGSWAAIVAVAAAAAVLVFFLYNMTQDRPATPACPPGTIWSHGHCHPLGGDR
jgi:hypothetical protein